MAAGGDDFILQQAEELLAAGVNAALIEHDENLQVADLQGQVVRRRSIPSPTPAEVLGVEVYRELDWEEEYLVYANLIRSSILSLEAMDPNVQNHVPQHLADTLSRARQAVYRERQLEIDVLRLVRDLNQYLPLRASNEFHAYSSIYRTNYAYQGVLVKECTNFSYSRAMLDREIAMSARFQQVTTPILSLKLTNSSNIFKLGVRYIASSLNALMRDQHQCEVIWNVSAELFRIMSAFEAGNNLLRDFRLESFRIEESKFNSPL